MKPLQYAIRGVAIALTLLQLWTILVEPLPLILHYVLFLAATLILVFGETLDQRTGLQRIIDLALIAATIGWAVFMALNIERYVTRIAFVDRPTTGDVIAGVALIVTLFEATRRAAGWGLFVIALLFTAYAFFGNVLPISIGHSGMSLSRFIDVQVLSNNGIFGIPLGAVVSYIFFFILFATFLEISGGGQLFIDLAFWLTGRTRGGPAKSAVIASGLMGSINGSAVANVVGTGTFTIPLMRRFGYKPPFAAAVEAASSTGGQLMPPIMGAAAFVMVELTGLDYVTILLGAAVPALLYYLAILFAVDLTAKRDGLRGLKGDEMPDVKTGLWKRLHLLLPLVILVYMMIDGSSLAMAAIYALAATVAVSMITRETRLTFWKVVEGFEKSAMSILIVAVPCAMAGLIIGVIVQTGIGLKFTGFILALSEGSLLLSLIAVMVACIILGMGMPTVSAYIMVAILMAPALTQLDLYILSVHLFIFYFALLSFVTPPVALASYAAAALAQTNSTTTGWQAFKLTLPGFLIPFAFAYNPALVMNGEWWEVIWVTATCAYGIFGIAGAFVGTHFRRSTTIERAVALVAAILLISPEGITDIIGAVLMTGMLAWQLQRPNDDAEASAKTGPQPAETREPSVQEIPRHAG
ncbi:TRAP transporter permease [Jiella avicenniae]|uniref:TRAP transporter fused permease subunit n=1 Tax=Jiella avicenniae TaxID=2907202 RepID=A0A9X1T4S5_9HYPH|nr:TRAP transporter fused permease subunit [Jiella avicenniae]MCE7027535.1 TRAP transporter fused permease subunit [Jiella avicenniae]